MKFTLLGGVVQKAKTLQTYIKKIKKYLTRERLTAISMLSKMVGIVIMFSVFPVGTLQISAKEDNIEKQTQDTAIRLNVQNSVPVTLNEPKIPNIVIGESNYQRKLREEKEIIEKTRKIVSRHLESRELSRSTQIDVSFESKRDLVKRAAQAYGIDWKLLEAVWQVESGKSWDTSVKSYAGAQGPMQFMPGTWRGVGVDGSGDGLADIYNAQDAVYSGARYLAQNGASFGNVDQALLAYNHAGWYVTKVKTVAHSIVE